MTEFDDDLRFMARAIELALHSERQGNLPVGAVITLDGEIIAEGHSAVLEPTYTPGHHAEVTALRKVDDRLWPRAREMTCYSTLEPCVMCAGTLLLHGIGRVVFGAYDTLGGAGCILDHLPPYYDEGGVYDWEGPLMPERCDELYERVDKVFADLPVGQNQWRADSGDDKTADIDELRRRLDAWRDGDDQKLSVAQARELLDKLANRLDETDRGIVVPYAAAIFEKTGYLKDFRRLRRYARRAGVDAFDDVEEKVLTELPDIWIKRALSRGEVDEAVDCWFEFADHRRIRLCADDLVEACDDAQTEVIISCRMSTVNYLIGRRARRHYRKACAVLRKLRDELRRAGEGDYWHFVVQDICTEYDNLPALIDELEKAGFLE